MSIFGNWPTREVQIILPDEPVWILGPGNFGRAVAQSCLAKGINVLGFIQTQPNQDFVDKLPVRGWSDLNLAERSASLLIGIFNRDTPLDSLVELATNFGFQRIILPWDIHAQFHKELGWRYWLRDSNYLRAHSNELNQIYERLADEKSRICLKEVVNFSLGLDIKYASKLHDEAQYFNNITLPRLEHKSVFYLDGGAYNGDTYCQLLATTQVKHAWLLEPDPKNFSELVLTVRDQSGLGTCLPLALSDGYNSLRFSSGLGEAAQINHQGDKSIVTVAIDDLLAGQSIDFIKLDIEGAEQDALRGATKTLATHRPVLALSCYHHPQDLWELVELIDDLVPDYNFYLRQHTYNSFDLVLYGLPK